MLQLEKDKSMTDFFENWHIFLKYRLLYRQEARLIKNVACVIAKCGKTSLTISLSPRDFTDSSLWHCCNL